MKSENAHQRLSFDILLEVSKYLELPFYHRLRATCRTIHTSLPSIPHLEFENFKRHNLLNFDKSKFRLKLSRETAMVYGVSPIVLFFLVKQKCAREFMRCYHSDRYFTIHKQIFLDYCADRCSYPKAEIALFILLGGRKGLDYLLSSRSCLKIICSLKQHHQDSYSMEFESGSPIPLLNAESELILDNLSDWGQSVTSFRNWFKNWYQIANDANMEIKSFMKYRIDDTAVTSKVNSHFFSSKEAPIEKILLSKSNFINPLKADILFTKAALVDQNTKLCFNIFSNPLIAALGERPALFHIAMNSNHAPIINIFLEQTPRICLAYHINKSSDGLDIPDLIYSKKFDVEAADNLALEMACRKKFMPVISLLLLSPMVFLSKNWKASPIRILFDNGYTGIVVDILKKGIPNTGAELSIFRRSIQKGNLDILKIFLQDKSGRFDPSSGNFKLLRLATKHPHILKELVSDPRCFGLSIIDLAPHFPLVSFDSRITGVLAEYVMNHETKYNALKSTNILSLCKIACATGHFDVVQTILNDRWRSFPSEILSHSLDAASFNGNLKVIKYMVMELGIEPKPIHVLSACTAGHPEVVSFLLNGGYLKDLDMNMIQVGVYDTKVNRVLYEFENKLWAASLQKVLSDKFCTPFKKIRLS